MGFDKKWEVKATIEITTIFLCDTKKEAEKEAYKYLSELCQGLCPIVVPTATKVRASIDIQRIEPYNAESEEV